MKTGIELITEERKRQMEVEGWDETHDDGHVKEQLAIAGAIYAMPSQKLDFQPEGFFRGDGDFRIPEDWPWDGSWYKPTNDRVKELTKAGALIAAEIDRLQRKNKS